MLRDMTSTLKRNVAAAAVAVAVLGGGAAAVAAEGPSRPTLAAEGEVRARGAQAAPAAEAPEGAEGRPGRPGHPGRPGQRLARRAVHGDLIVRGKEGEFENVTFDRGRLTSVEGGSLTLERPDGVSVTVTLNDATRYRGVEATDALRVDRPVFVTSKDGTATLVAQRPERAEREGRVPISDPSE